VIPRLIHYCWFGREAMPAVQQAYVNQWRTRLKDYQFVRWSEDNFDVRQCRFVQNAYDRRQWAFVADYARLKVLNDYGGIYLDTDVELKGNFDDYLACDTFLGFMYNCTLGTAVIGASRHSRFTTELLDKYTGDEVNTIEPNNIVVTDYFLETFPGFRLDNSRQESAGVVIEPKEVFEQPDIRGRGVSVHHYSGSWIVQEQKSRPRRFGKITAWLRGIPLVLYCYRQFRCARDARVNPIYSRYRQK
jgi:hypothetical protein